MLPSGNDAAAVLAEGFGSLMYLDENGEKFSNLRKIKLI